MIKAKITSLKEEIRSIDFADVLYWKRKEHGNAANAEYLGRRNRLREITRELAVWEKNAWPFAVKRLSIRQRIFYPVTQDTQLPRDDEECRLLAIFKASRAQEHAAADQLSHPRHSMLYPAYVRLVDALGVIRVECNETRLAVRAHRKKMRDEGNSDQDTTLCCDGFKPTARSIRIPISDRPLPTDGMSPSRDCRSN